MTIRTLLLMSLALAACGRSDRKPTEEHAATDCGSMKGDNAVQTEMRMLECALGQAIVAIGRDDLASIPHAIHTVHGAKQQTEQALESGAYKVEGGDLETFVSMDEAFHRTLVTLVEASRANDHAATAAALGGVLGQCQGCHGTFRRVK